jgi:hypothetical protein
MYVYTDSKLFPSVLETVEIYVPARDICNFSVFKVSSRNVPFVSYDSVAKASCTSETASESKLYYWAM